MKNSVEMNKQLRKLLLEFSVGDDPKTDDEVYSAYNKEYKAYLKTDEARNLILAAAKRDLKRRLNEPGFLDDAIMDNFCIVDKLVVDYLKSLAGEKK